MKPVGESKAARNADIDCEYMVLFTQDLTQLMRHLDHRAILLLGQAVANYGSPSTARIDPLEVSNAAMVFAKVAALLAYLKENESLIMEVNNVFWAEMERNIRLAKAN
jgi:hypothetical protein